LVTGCRTPASISSASKPNSTWSTVDGGRPAFCEPAAHLKHGVDIDNQLHAPTTPPVRPTPRVACSGKREKNLCDKVPERLTARDSAA
jgi:hypothetical protein